MSKLKWFLCVAAAGYVLWNSAVRIRAIEGISWVARAFEQTEIDRLVGGLGDLDSEAMAIDDEIGSLESLLEVLPEGAQARGIRRRISDLKSRTAATLVEKGKTVASVDRLIEPARETIDDRALAMGYVPENTTFVVVGGKGKEDQLSDNPAEIHVTQPIEPVYVNTPEPTVSDDECPARNVKAYVYRVVPARTIRKSRCGH